MAAHAVQIKYNAISHICSFCKSTVYQQQDYYCIMIHVYICRGLDFQCDWLLKVLKKIGRHPKGMIPMGAREARIFSPTSLNKPRAWSFKSLINDLHVANWYHLFSLTSCLRWQCTKKTLPVLMESWYQKTYNVVSEGPPKILFYSLHC